MIPTKALFPIMRLCAFGLGLLVYFVPMADDGAPWSLPTKPIGWMMLGAAIAFCFDALLDTWYVFRMSVEREGGKS